MDEGLSEPNPAVPYKLLGGPHDGLTVTAPADVFLLVIRDPVTDARHRYDGLSLQVVSTGGRRREFLSLKYAGPEPASD